MTGTSKRRRGMVAAPLAALFAFLIALLVPQAALASGYAYIADRGDVGGSYEPGTIGAFRQAAQTDGIAGMQAEAWLTGDGYIVCARGSGSDRADWHGTDIRTATLAQLRSADPKPPTLAQFLRICARSGKQASIVLKDSSFAAGDTAQEALGAELAAFGRDLPRISFVSASEDALDRAASTAASAGAEAECILSAQRSEAAARSAVSRAAEKGYAGVRVDADFALDALGAAEAFPGISVSASCGHDEATARSLIDAYGAGSAVVEFAPEKHEVRFVDGLTGNVVKTQMVVHGGDAVAPAAPEHAGHAFAGWDGDASSVVSDVVVTASYEPQMFHVIFRGPSGEVLSEQDVPYGAAAVPPEPPAQSGKSFSGWSGGYSHVTADADLSAAYADEMRKVTFLDPVEGTVVASYDVPSGSEATAPEAPGHDGYRFVKWVASAPDGAVDETLTAQYAVHTYTVTFRDGLNGSTIGQPQKVQHGKAATAPPIPAHDGYMFCGWDSALSGITASKTITAKYEPIELTVSFVDGLDGKVISKQQVIYKKDATPPEPPSHPGYRFAGWKGAYTSVVDDVTVTASYEASGEAPGNRGDEGFSAEQFEIVFVDGIDGKELSRQKVEQGKSAVPPEPPAHDGYRFSKWQGAYSNVSADATVTAVYDKAGAASEYTVTFVDGVTGGVIERRKVAAGKDAEAPEPPAHDGWRFEGWDGDMKSVSQDRTVTAVYADASAAKTHLVTFVDGIDGTTIAKQRVGDGKAAVMPSPRVHDGFAFSGWSPKPDSVTQDMTVTAEYAKLPAGAKTHRVLFVDGLSGSSISEQQVADGAAAQAPAPPAHDGFSFSGWDRAFDKVTSDMTVTATYAADADTSRMLSVSFIDGVTGEEFANRQVRYGAGADVPTPPAHAGYRFSHWSEQFSHVTHDMKVTAVYGRVGMDGNLMFSVRFKDGLDGRVLMESLVEKGQGATPPQPPEHEGYRFAAWSGEYSAVSQDTDVTAVYVRADGSADGVMGVISSDIAEGGTVSVGDVVTYTASLSNHSQQPARGVAFKSRIPDGTEYMAGSLAASGAEISEGGFGGGLVSGTLAELAPSAMAQVSYKVSVREVPEDGGKLAASLEYSQGAVDTVTVKSDEVKAAPQAAVMVSAPEGGCPRGGQVELSLTMSNAGTAALSGYSAKLEVDGGAELAQGSSGEWEGLSIPPGSATIVKTARVSVPAGFEGDSFTATATLFSPTSGGRAVAKSSARVKVVSSAVASDSIVIPSGGGSSAAGSGKTLAGEQAGDVPGDDGASAPRDGRRVSGKATGQVSATAPARTADGAGSGAPAGDGRSSASSGGGNGQSPVSMSPISKTGDGLPAPAAALLALAGAAIAAAAISARRRR